MRNSCDENNWMTKFIVMHNEQLQLRYIILYIVSRTFSPASIRIEKTFDVLQFKLLLAG